MQISKCQKITSLSNQTKFFQIVYCPLVLFDHIAVFCVWGTTCLIFVVCTTVLGYSFFYLLLLFYGENLIVLFEVQNNQWFLVFFVFL